MSVNKLIAAKFEKMSHMLEVLGEDRFRVNAHARAARSVEETPEDLAELASDIKALVALEGIGKKMAEKIIEFCETGNMRAYDELAARVPDGLLDLLELPGVGPKTVRSLWKDGGVENLEDLKRVIDDGSILELPRMGQKTVENIKKAVESFTKRTGRLHAGIAHAVAMRIINALEPLDAVGDIAFAGSLRRGRETVGDLDILVSSNDADTVSEAFRTMPGVQRVIVAGETKTSVEALVQEHDPRFGPPEDGRTIQVDLRVVPAKHWGAALMYFTGSKDHNVKLRERALKQNLTLNEYGLYPIDDEKTAPQKRGIKPVASKTEASIYKTLDLPFIPPEIREDRGEFELTKTPKLVDVDDIKAELHAHTTASDGRMTIEELALAAKERGFHTIAVTDHSKSQVIAGGLQADKLLEHAAAVRKADEQIDGITILAGTEVDILTDGSLDYDDDVLAQLDVVVASPHAALTQAPDVATDRLLRAIENPNVHIIGHPTGRMIQRRGALDPVMSSIVAAAVEHNTALEVNAHWMRLDLRDTHVRAAVDAGALIAINCDVHRRHDFDNLPFGVSTARRGWLTPASCINTWTPKKLHEWLKQQR